MISKFSLEQLSKIGYGDSNLEKRQHKLDLMARIIKIRYIKAKLKKPDS